MYIACKIRFQIERGVVCLTVHDMTNKATFRARQLLTTDATSPGMVAMVSGKAS